MLNWVLKEVPPLTLIKASLGREREHLSGRGFGFTCLALAVSAKLLRFGFAQILKEAFNAGKDQG